jgi:hypothetical protein
MKISKVLIVTIIVIFFSGCGVKYIPHKGTLIKEVKWDTREEYDKFEKENKNITLDGYDVEFYQVEPYLLLPHQYLYKRISLRDELSFRETYYLSYSEWFYDYTFLMFTITKEAFNKNMRLYFNTINTTYETKLNPKSINKFVYYPCDNNITFDEYERDENYQPLKATCYAKRLEKDVFLITRFAHPNTQDDTKLFKNEIIPTMLKAIKVTPTKLSPWKYY